MQALRVVALFAALCTSAVPTWGAPIDVTFETQLDEESITFGLNPFQWSGPLASQHDVWMIDQGSVGLTSGPLLSLTLDAAQDQTVYTYGAGTIDVSVFVDGLHGTWTASTQGFSVAVCEGCDSLFGGGLADDFTVDFGPGLFNAVFAKMLGVSVTTTGGSVQFGLEAIDGDPSAHTRQAFDHRGSVTATIDATAVPEPSLLVLSAVVCGAVSVTRRRRRQRT